jgi:type II secretory pathway predicted ATPase ExeA
MNFLGLLNHHFGLTIHPFDRPVPPSGLLLHRSFAEAQARLRWAMDGWTPALLTAEPGLGKSTLLGTLADSLDKTTTRVVYTPLSSCKPFGLIGQLAHRFAVRPRRTAAQTAQAMLDELSGSKLTEILILDEAHRLPKDTLDELRLISNLDFDRTPPFWLLLVGLPALRERLAQPEHISLLQRLAIRTSLAPLSEPETADYLDRRLRAAGAPKSLFLPPAVAKLFEKTRGVPRLVNNLATAALVAAATANKRYIDLPEVEDASFDLDQA